MGATGINVSSVPIIVELYPDKVEYYLSVRLGVAGFSIMTGPLIGSALINYMSFSMILLIYTLVYAVVVVTICKLLKVDKQ